MTKTYRVGDRIKFRAATRWSDRAVVRTVNGFDGVGQPTVRFGGWAHFVVRSDEVVDVFKREEFA